MGRFCQSTVPPTSLTIWKYQELKHRLSSSELRMEFYLDLLYDFCRLGDQFLGVYGHDHSIMSQCDQAWAAILQIIFYVT